MKSKKKPKAWRSSPQPPHLAFPTSTHILLSPLLRRFPTLSRGCGSAELFGISMKILQLLFCALIIGMLSGCEPLNLASHSSMSKTDVASLHKGAPSAEVLISFFSVFLKDETDGHPVPGGYGTYREYWQSRMQDIAVNESKEYYSRVFRDFNDARARVGLSEIPVPPYESFHASAQSSGAANDSQPFRFETNTTSLAAGSVALCVNRLTHS